MFSVIVLTTVLGVIIMLGMPGVMIHIHVIIPALINSIKKTLQIVVVVTTSVSNVI